MAKFKVVGDVTITIRGCEFIEEADDADEAQRNVETMFEVSKDMLDNADPPEIDVDSVDEIAS